MVGCVELMPYAPAKHAAFAYVYFYFSVNAEGRTRP
jgi:hypothetical protein